MHALILLSWYMPGDVHTGLVSGRVHVEWSWVIEGMFIHWITVPGGRKQTPLFIMIKVKIFIIVFLIVYAWLLSLLHIMQRSMDCMYT